MLRRRIALGRRAATCGAVLVLVLVLLCAGAAGASTLGQVRRQLLSWHLRPVPVFPAHLPRSFSGAGTKLSRTFDFDVSWSRDRAGLNVFAFSFRRGSRALLNQELHDPRNLSVRQVQIGRRHTYFILANKAILTWHEQGRTYILLDKYAASSTALRTFKAFVKSLRRL